MAGEKSGLAFGFRTIRNRLSPVKIGRVRGKGTGEKTGLRCHRRGILPISSFIEGADCDKNVMAIVTEGKGGYNTLVMTYLKMKFPEIKAIEINSPIYQKHLFLLKDGCRISFSTGFMNIKEFETLIEFQLKSHKKKCNGA